MERRKSRLAQMMEADGHTLIPQPYGFKLTCPFCRTRKPTCVVYEHTRYYHCLACRTDGMVLDYLTRFRGLTRKQARAVYRGDAVAIPNPRPPRVVRPIKAAFRVRRELPPRHDGRYLYFTDASETKIRFVVQRYQRSGHRTAWMAYERYLYKGEERWRKTLTALEPRPLYNLRRVDQAGPATSITIVHNESRADALAVVEPRAVITCASGRTRLWRQTDWEPLFGRGRLLLVADGTSASHAYMRELALFLWQQSCASLSLVLPPVDDRELHIGKALADGVSARAFIAQFRREWQPPQSSR